MWTKLFIILFLFSTSGCLPGFKSAKVETVPKTPQTTLLPSVALEKRIDYLKALLDDGTLHGKDREIAEDLLRAYEIIRSAPVDTEGNYDYQKIIRSLFTNLGRLEERYFLSDREDRLRQARVLALFANKKRKILDAYLAGDYQGVINDCIELEAAFGRDSLTPEITLLFALSLAKKGMLAEAVNIGEKILRRQEGMPDLHYLKASIVQWQADLGNREEAMQAFDKLTDDLDEMRGILMIARQKVDEKAPQSEKPLQEGLTSGPIQVQNDIPKALRSVESLINKHAFNEAKLLLIKQRLRTEDGPELETIDQALKTVQLAEERFRAEQMASDSRRKLTLKQARGLIEEENFEEALTRLDELKDDEGMTSEIHELKDLAIEKLMNRDRDKAAKIFLLAKKTSDPTRKKELLLSSYEILKVLIDKYPSSTLINKLNNNIKKVKEELLNLGVDPG